MIKKKRLKNKFEKKIDTQLDRSLLKYKYESEKIPFVIASHYCPDFVVQTPTGKLYIECKGYYRPEHKRKMAAVKKQHSDLDIRIVFYSYSKVNIKWCERYGFRYAIGSIPSEWLNGL